MIINRSFVFVHIPKTGGTWMRFALHWIPGFETELNGHPSYSQLNPIYRGRPAFAYVRNPWDWYGSLYSHYHSNFRLKKAEFVSAPPEAKAFLTARFGGTLQQMCDHFDRFDHSNANEHVSDVVKKMCTPPNDTAPAIKIYRYEDGLSETLYQFLEERRLQIPSQIKRRIDNIKNSRFNQHQQERPLGFASPTFVQWVERHNKGLIEQYGYQPPSGLIP